MHSGSDETREAVAAFHEKRAPRFDELRFAQAVAARLPALRRDRPARRDPRLLPGVCGNAPAGWRAESGRVTDEQLVLVERQPEQRTALVRLNRPKQLNALNGPVMDACATRWRSWTATRRCARSW